MGSLQVGHGSEFHLLRFLGRHRHQFNQQLEEQLAADGVGAIDSVGWLDFPLNPKVKTRDGEILGVDFLTDHGGQKWRDYWPDRNPGKPNRPGMPSWDAVGSLNLPDGSSEWLLVEAKAHTGEFASPSAACGAGGGSRETIARALEKTYAVLRSPEGLAWDDVSEQWLGQYYQLANRLAVLNFLRSDGQPARLVYVLFSGDSYRRCPKNGKEWSKQFDVAYEAMGLERKHALSPWCHQLCVNVTTGARV